MKKNDFLTGICEQIGYNGEGIFHIEGTTFFVPYCLCGEKVTFKVLKVKNGIGYGKVQTVLEESPDRVTPKCPVFTKCGGCQLLHANYKTQLQIKKQTVENAFKKIANIKACVENVYFSEDEFFYRNKLQLPVRDQKGKVAVGFFRENSHDIVETDDCIIQPAWCKDVIKIIKDFVDGKKVTAYNEITKKGLVRHVVVREIDGEFIFTIVINGDKINGVNGLIDRLSAKFGKISVYLNINKMDNNVILGDKFILLYGDGKITLNEFGITYKIGPQSFMQVNNKVKKMLYEKVTSFAKEDDEYVVIDGYSGAGVLTAMLCKDAKRAYGVEIIKEAVDSANQLAIDNGLKDKMTNIAAPCEDVLPDLIKKEAQNKTVLVLDPPRKGVDLKILQAALNAKPDKIIYVACSPQSVARDVGVLTDTLKVEGGKITGFNPNPNPIYTIKSINLFDLFPQTKHVECVVMLSKEQI